MCHMFSYYKLDIKFRKISTKKCNKLMLLTWIRFVKEKKNLFSNKLQEFQYR